MAVEVEVPRRLFTVEEYHRMAEAGILGEDERVELIEGEIIQMAPIGPQHAGSVININRLFVTRLGDRAVVSPQNPVVIRPRSEPQPDLVLLRPRAVSYSRGLPASQDVLLVVEVADTTVRFDRLVKARLYAPTSSPDALDAIG
jgi:Uma2 family endonuclease